mmetsp:Transcript_12320/g.28241  ORF Transcript_12320/g.28241 Transcript_12320/m.28241 type:complete len:221 (-) Transcript_12320:33-695(-)
MAESGASERAVPPDDQLAAEIAEVLKGSDLTKMSLKEVRSELERRFKLSAGALDNCRDKLKELVSVEIARIQEKEEGGEDGDDAEAAADAEVEAEAVGVTAQRSPKDKSKKASKEEKEDRRKSGQKRQRDDSPQGAMKVKAGSKSQQAEMMTVKDFMKRAKSFSVQIGEKKITVEPRRFSTGSCGFYANGKAMMMLGDQPVALQCQINCAVIGSKTWKDA